MRYVQWMRDPQTAHRKSVFSRMYFLIHPSSWPSNSLNGSSGKYLIIAQKSVYILEGSVVQEKEADNNNNYNKEEEDNKDKEEEDEDNKEKEKEKEDNKDKEEEEDNKEKEEEEEDKDYKEKEEEDNDEEEDKDNELVGFSTI